MTSPETLDCHVEESAVFVEKSESRVDPIEPPASESPFNPHEVVNPEWKSPNMLKYRKRVYAYWKKANDRRRLPETRKANGDKARKAFAWFEEHGCTVEPRAGGRVSIKFPKQKANE